MLIIDESTVKVGGIILPGIFKSFEIKGSAKVEELEIEGQGPKPKQATGYSDSKLNLELRLLDDESKTALDKLKIIQSLFKKSGQKKPAVYDIINEHTTIRGITKVIFKNLTTKVKSDKTEIVVSLEFWEYIPFDINVLKRSSKGSQTQSSYDYSSINLNDNYMSYLYGRNRAPTVFDKIRQTPSVDDCLVDMHAFNKKYKNLPF